MTTSIDLEELTRTGALRRGHFLLSSGLHAADYLQCALYLAEPSRAERAGRAVAEIARAESLQPDLVVSPALGGVIIGHETARALGVPFVFTERSNGSMALRRGFEVTGGQRVLVVEDVVTTGGSTREVIELIAEHGGEVLGVASLVNRSRIANPFAPLPYHPLLVVDFPVWTPEECPLCREGKPIDRPGSRTPR
jgi:orotate phosphoribosyltransferase